MCGGQGYRDKTNEREKSEEKSKRNRILVMMERGGN